MWREASKLHPDEREAKRRGHVGEWRVGREERSTYGLEDRVRGWMGDPVVSELGSLYSQVT